MSSTAALAAGAASLVVTLAACGSDSEASSTSTTSTTSSASLADEFIPQVTETGDPASAMCPTAMPPTDGTPEWTLNGTTGSVAVTGSTDATAPVINVEAPFSVTETQVHTLQPGDGPVVSETAKVFVCYMGVNGRDGSVFDNSYERGMPVDFPLDGVVPGFQKAIAGQKVGSTVAVAMTSADGYPEGQPAAGIQPGDSLIFAIKILDASS
ncbi:peptidylprolyl isomerase [Mycolicibacterium sp. GF69]|uniref:FKBP-type peptidyl-prolyl cis-trans isomerase n=1 Tax=Mycolicibacterium sp. GF69 TaxID=2267251 RepID=UPI000DCC4F03|nr:FKBP-type peptidyl-prolyl cis-trans isomerase [Mycolicibacterium sp. GF69]RAV11674.1 peptidylprolyl isomerase [Mycolicibacterium sp. GF69]